MGDMGFLIWKDNLAWTENAKQASPAFTKEMHRFERLIRGIPRESLSECRSDFSKAFKAHTEGIHDEINLGSVNIRPILQTSGYIWKSKPSGHYTQCENIDCLTNGTVITTRDITHGAQDYRIYKHAGWSYPLSVSPEFGIYGGRVYIIEADGLLRYKTLISLDVATGGSRRLHYHERNEETNLRIVRVSGGLFMKGYKSGVQSLFLIQGGAERLEPDGVSFFPVAVTESMEPIYFVRRRSFASGWTLVGASWNLNSEIRSEGIEFCSLYPPFLITKHSGKRTGWILSTKAPPLKVFCRFGQAVLPLLLSCHKYQLPKCILWNDCGATGSVMSLKGIITEPHTRYARVSGSKWALMTHPSGEKPRALLIISYATYDYSLSMNTSRWRPWIDCGWGVALLFVQGGGDSNELKAEAGRREGRLKTVTEVDEAIKELQGITMCSPEQTCLYGRSAGGLILGRLATLYPNGERFKMIYAEVPYVDMLKSASNPQLPLTPLEYNEIGDPRRGPLEFYTALQLSPVHSIGSVGAPGLYVLCRASKNDKEVYPYECLKWILSLRGNRKGGDGKVLSLNGSGHFTPLKDAPIRYAEDLMIMEQWCFTAATK
jgi:hypothetical protein